MKVELKYATEGLAVDLPEELDMHVIRKLPIPEITRPTNNHPSVVALAISR